MDRWRGDWSNLGGFHGAGFPPFVVFVLSNDHNSPFRSGDVDCEEMEVPCLGRLDDQDAGVFTLVISAHIHRAGDYVAIVRTGLAYWANSMAPKGIILCYLLWVRRLVPWSGCLRGAIGKILVVELFDRLAGPAGGRRFSGNTQCSTGHAIISGKF